MYQRSFYALAGYTYQGMLVMKALQGRYLGVPEFEALRVLIHDKKYRQHREYLKAIRNFAAFHLDEYDVMTRSTLSQLKAAHYDLLSADSDTLISYYFQFADTIDMEFLYLKFGNGRSWEDTLADISSSVLQFSSELVNGCFEFMFYLTVKSELHKYIEKRSVPYRNAEGNQPGQDRMMRLWEKIKNNEETMEDFTADMHDDVQE
ncbi:MAG: hypothetical protein H0V76_08390 [Blastocatellia bacterium]|nr:hypothetical protein [Blastocatellia bacterium]